MISRFVDGEGTKTMAHNISIAASFLQENFRRAKWNRLIQTILCATALGLFSSGADAVSVTNIDISEIGCTVLVSGEFTQGSAQKVRDHLVAKGANTIFPDSDALYYGGRLCFDSPGGSFLEGLELANALYGTRTGVDEGHRCESACFLSFMAGTIDRLESLPLIPDRVMHPQAKLGYHSPGILIEDRNFSSTEVKRAWDIALLSIAEILKIRNVEPTPNSSGSYFFRDELLESMLRVSFDDMRYITTVHDALFYNIIVYPAILPFQIIGADDQVVSLSDPAFANACRSLGIMAEDFYIDSGPSDASLIYDQDLGTLKFTANFDEGKNVTTCEIEYRLVGSEAFNWDTQEIQGVDLFFQSDTRSSWMVGNIRASDWWIPENHYKVAAFMHYPANTRIIDLEHPKNHQSINSTMLSVIERGFMNSYEYNSGQFSCFISSDQARIINVNEFVNLRNRAGFTSRVIERIMKGETVRLVNGNSIRSTRSCIDACQALSVGAREYEEIRDFASQCVENNDVWIEVVTSNNRRGWISRKFLGEVQ